MKEVIGAVDVGGTKIAVGLVTPQGEVIARAEIPSRTGISFDNQMEAIAGRLLGHLDRRAEIDPCQLLGIGIAATGQVDPLEGVVLRNGLMPEWTARNPVRWLAERFGVTAALENDADAAALAEWQFGAGQGAVRFIFLTISTGIGGGMIFSGRLYRGAGGAHPEIGHHTIDPDGPLCFCGNRGCWETLASGSALQQRYQALMPAFSGDARAVCDLAETGDLLAKQAVETHGQMIGIGLANLIVMYAPDVIVLGGGLMQRIDLFLPVIRATIAARCTLVPVERTHLKPNRFSTDSSLVGAAVVWAHRFRG